MTVAPPKPRTDRPARLGTRHGRVTIVTGALLFLLIAGVLWSLSIGVSAMPLPKVIAGLVHTVTGGDSASDLIIRTVRLPRVLLALLVGASAAVAGTTTQAITSNPIVAPEILGVNAGAAIVAVAVITVFPTLGGVSVVALAFAGAAVTGLFVMTVAGAATGGTSQVRLALAGFTVTTLLLSITQGLIIFHENGTDAVFFWLVGGVNFAQMTSVTTILPWTVAGIVAAIALAGKLDLLSLGEDVARGLGERVERIRLMGAIVVIVLAGSSVAVAGPIAFVGLITPHIIRRLTGGGHRIVLPLSAMAGAVLLIYSDIASRFVDPPTEVPAGVVTALIGAPIFVFLARRQQGAVR